MMGLLSQWTAPVRQWFSRQDTVSGAWMRSQALDETKVGWDGPRWRTPAERRQMARDDRRKLLRRATDLEAQR